MGNKVTETVEVEVANLPPIVTAEASPMSGNVPLTVSFTATATDAEGIQSYAWDFDGDGETDATTTTPTTSFTYDDTGTFNTVVLVTDISGAEATFVLEPVIVLSVPILVPVPQLIGQIESSVASALEAVGLNLGEVTVDSSNTVEAGLVISQSPTANSLVGEEASVSIVVSSGSEAELVDVPDLTGLTEAAARTSLEDLSLVLGEVTNEVSDTVPLGQVITQNPLPLSLIHI